ARALGIVGLELRACAFFLRRITTAAARNDEGLAQVKADKAGWSEAPQRGRHRRSPIPALRDVTRIAQPRHEFRPSIRDLGRVPAPAAGPIRKTKAWQGWQDQMKSVLNGAAMCRGVGERRDHLVELHNRSGPAMGHQKRQRVLMRRTNVKE